MAGEEEGWPLYRVQVLSELKRINENIEKLADSDTALRITVGKLQLVAAIVGGVAGVSASIIAFVFVTVLG